MIEYILFNDEDRGFLASNKRDAITFFNEPPIEVSIEDLIRPFKHLRLNIYDGKKLIESIEYECFLDVYLDNDIEIKLM